MVNFLDSIFDFLMMIVDLVTNFVHGVVQMLGMVAGAVSFTTTVIGSLPTPLVVFAVAFVTVSVVYLIIGR